MAFLSHCGSRGIGHDLASGQFKTLQRHFEKWNIPLPGERPSAGVRTSGNTRRQTPTLTTWRWEPTFATVNHLLINALVLEAFQEVIPGVQGKLVYFISHNIARKEVVGDCTSQQRRDTGRGSGRSKKPDRRWSGFIVRGRLARFRRDIMRLKGTMYETTGHPILLPGNPQAGSCVMVADEGAAASCYSVNHGAGRALGRKRAFRELDQAAVDKSFDDADILSNCRVYPRDEAPAAYKDFDEVLRSVKSAGLATEVARLKAPLCH